MLNPYERVDEQPELRLSDDKGLGPVHIAVKKDHLEILKVLLDTDKTLLCMQTENDDLSYIIHLAVTHNKLDMIRYLLGSPAFFRLFSEKQDPSQSYAVLDTVSRDPY